MRRRVTIGLGLAVAGLSASLAGTNFATAEVDAVGLSEVKLVDIPAPTHFDWFTREVAGKTHVIAMVGSRDSTPKEESIPPRGQTWVDQRPGGGVNLVDVTDPENPQFLLNAWCPTDNNDVAYIEVEGGYWINPLTTDAAAPNAPNAHLYDGFVLLASNDKMGCAHQNGDPWSGAVSVVGLRATPNPGDVVTADWLSAPWRDPSKAVAFPFRFPGSPAAHTVVAHPTKPIAYVGNQTIGNRYPTVEILDLRTWPPTGKSAPLWDTHVVGPRNVDVPRTAGVAPHDITFSPDGNRAYASAISASYVWDTSGSFVTAPKTIGTLFAPNLKIHHETVLHPNGRHLLTVDEFVATSNENIPACPGGGIHVFDQGPLTEDGTRAFESAPVPVGQFYADEIGTLVHFGINGTEPDLSVSCTAHEFNISADGSWMPLAWFGAGVRMLDLSMLNDPLVLESDTPMPVVIQETGHFMTATNDVWAARQHPLLDGYVFASDTAEGFRILKRVE